MAIILILEMKNKTFTFEKFYQFIEFRSFYDCHYSKKEILLNAFYSYISIVKRKAISRANGLINEKIINMKY